MPTIGPLPRNLLNNPQLIHEPGSNTERDLTAFIEEIPLAGKDHGNAEQGANDPSDLEAKAAKLPPAL